MEEKRLKRLLTIGFMDFLSISQRTTLVESELALEEIVEKYADNKIKDCSVDECIKWLNSDKLNKIWWNWEPVYPDFSGFERHIPYMLFVHGFTPKPRNRSVAIVGTRHTDNQGLQDAYSLGLEASANRIYVVSGIAQGSDQAALQGAVDGLYPSFAVLGSGIDVDYPAYSGKLKSAIVDSGGAVISRFAPGTPPLKYNFPNRNTIISAMGQLTIVVQAPKKSGSLITADLTLQQGKDVCVSKAGLGNKWGRIGSNQLAEQGAMVIGSISDVFECQRKVQEAKPFDRDVKRFGNKLYVLREI